MATQLNHQALLDAIGRALPESYVDPLRVTGDGYEMLHGQASIGERCSLAVRRFELDGFIMSSQGARQATVPATFYRLHDGAGAGTVLAGTLVRARRGGQVYRTTENAVFGATALTVTVPAIAIGFGYEWNIAGPFTDPDGNMWPGELDTVDLPLQDPPFWDPTIMVRNEAPADGLGRPGALDAIGADERGLPRQPNEADVNYRVRVRTLPDVVSPGAIERQVRNFLRPYGLTWRLVETWEHRYQECYDAPDDGPTPYEPYDANLFCYDDPRPPSPFQNRWLGETDHVGAFVLEIQTPPGIIEYAFAYDDEALDEEDLETPTGIRAWSAYDVPLEITAPSLVPAYDGEDVGLLEALRQLASLLDEIKAGGVYAVGVFTEM